jgi:hypothetical protein
MKRRISIVVALAIAVAIVCLAMPAAFAQCGTAREIAMRQNGANYGRIGVDTQALVPVLNNQTEVAIFWESGNSANNTGGPHMGGAPGSSSCDSATGNGGGSWWSTGGTGGGQPANARSIQMFLSSTGCTLTVCPGAGGSLTVLVEDITADGSDAAYYLITADETPGPIRYYDLARADPATQPSNDVTHPMWNHPRVSVASSSGPPPNTTLTNAYKNADVEIWGVGPQGSAAQQIDSYDVFVFHGAAEPGRTRSAWGAPHHTIPYNNTPQGAPIPDSFLVPCPEETNDTYVAVGLTFDGIPSYYVGKSTAVECDPSIADPDRPSELRRARPSLQRGSRGGR